MNLVHDHTLTAGELIPGMRVHMPHSYRQLFIEAVFAVQGNRVLVVGIPSGPPYGGPEGLTDEQLDERRTYIEFKAADPVVATYFAETG